MTASSSPLPQFLANGVCRECRDRIPYVEGRYAVSNRGVCATLEGGSRVACWQVYADGRGDFLLRHIPPGATSPPERITLRPPAP